MLQLVYTAERSKRELAAVAQHARRVAVREAARAAASEAGEELPPPVPPRRALPDERVVRGMLRCANGSCGRRSKSLIHRDKNAALNILIAWLAGVDGWVRLGRCPGPDDDGILPHLARVDHKKRDAKQKAAMGGRFVLKRGVAAA